MLDDRFVTHSSRMLDNDGSWDRSGNLYGWTALLGDRRGTDDVSYYAAPARAKDLSGLPRTFIDVGDAEGFRDEVIDYARGLVQAGVSVDLHVWVWKRVCCRQRRRRHTRSVSSYRKISETRISPSRQPCEHAIRYPPNGGLPQRNSIHTLRV